MEILTIWGFLKTFRFFSSFLVNHILCIVGELAVGGSVIVAVGVGDR